MISISVVMPTYNATGAMLCEAVESILSQSFGDFEFIIIDDGSTDDSSAYLQTLCDERIRLIRNSKNLGITKSLNIGFREAKGKYIARMDSDDIAMPARLEKQFAFMESHPDVIVCGTSQEFFGDRSGQFHGKVMDMEDYRLRLLFRNPGPAHSTAFFNRELLLRYHICYDESLVYAQDYGLWVDISRCGKVFIMDDVLLRRRVHSHQITKEHRDEQVQCEKMTQARLLRELLGSITDEEVDFHHLYSSWNNREVKINERVLNWYHRLIEANNRAAIYNKTKMKSYVFNVILKRLINQSFELDMSYAARLSLYFKYMPFPTALRSSMKMSARIVADRVFDNN